MYGGGGRGRYHCTLPRRPPMPGRHAPGSVWSPRILKCKEHVLPERVTIDVDLGPLAAEWEVVAIRPAKTGEFIMSPGWNWKYATCTRLDSASDGTQVVVRRRWKWPAGLTCAAIAMDADGKWWAYEVAPEHVRGSWESVGEVAELRDWQIDLPAVDDWRESLRLNPHREKST